jgi:PhnB protein
MASVNIYLTFDGNCEEAFKFYKSVFGGEFPYVGRYKDMPPPEGGGKEFSAAEGERIMHMSLPVGDGTVLMGSDTGGEWASSFKQGNNFSISVNAESKEEADNIFNSLSAGGFIGMPMAKTFWGDYFGMCTDKFGINWMMSFNENPQKMG